MIKAIECYKANTHSQHNRITAAFSKFSKWKIPAGQRSLPIKERVPSAAPQSGTTYAPRLLKEAPRAMRSKHPAAVKQKLTLTAPAASIEAPRCDRGTHRPHALCSNKRQKHMYVFTNAGRFTAYPSPARIWSDNRRFENRRLRAWSFKSALIPMTFIAGKKQKQKQKTEADEDLRSLDLRGALLGGGLDFLLLLKRFKPMIETQQKREQHEKQQQQHKHASDA